jgi:aspartate 1-decarboxylase
MKRIFCRSKIHQARVTDKNLEYQGSITLDKNLIEAVDLISGEMVSILDLENGNRFETYVIEGDRNSGEVCINGAAARLVEINDRILILSFGIYEPSEIEENLPKVIYLDKNNNIIPSPEKE